MTNTSPLVLVAGSTGVLGGQVVRKLLAAGVPVRAVGRNTEVLSALAAAGAETVALDLLDRPAVARACEGVGQVYSTANNVLGSGGSSPNRVDVAAHESLLDAARGAGVRRFVYLSGRGMDTDSPVDFFRTKRAIEDLVRASGIPFVLIQASAFMETWVGMLADSIRKNGTVALFGDGSSVWNYVAIEDVAEISLRILMSPEVVNEAIEIGGPSNLSGEQLAGLIQAHMGVTAKRRKIPKAVLWSGGLLLRPFNEVVSRFMRMGYFQATQSADFAEWDVAANRFGVSPMTVETFLAKSI